MAVSFLLFSSRNSNTPLLFYLSTAFKEVTLSMGGRKPASNISGSTTHLSTETPSLQTYKHQHAPLDQRSHRRVKFWHIDFFIDWLKDARTITKIEDTGEKERALQSAYIEDINGNRVSESHQTSIFAHARSLWVTLLNAGVAPPTFSLTGSDIMAEFVYEMERKYSELQLCHDSWKAKYIWKKNYPSWYKDAIGKAGPRSGKRQRSPIELTDDDDEEEVSRSSKKIREAAKKVTRPSANPGVRKHQKVCLVFDLYFY